MIEGLEILWSYLRMWRLRNCKIIMSHTGRYTGQITRKNTYLEMFQEVQICLVLSTSNDSELYVSVVASDSDVVLFVMSGTLLLQWLIAMEDDHSDLKGSLN